MTTYPRQCSAREALSEFARTAGTAIGFAYTPVAAPWFRLDAEGQPRDSRGEPLDLASVFELRAFDDTRELRWHNTSGEQGTANLVDDTTACTPPRTRGRRYRRLLWGTVRRSGEQHHDWVTLFDARIGRLPVPVNGAVAEGWTVWLEAVEYHTEDAHGNVSVVDERLTCLVAKKPKKATAESGTPADSNGRQETAR